MYGAQLVFFFFCFVFLRLVDHTFCRWTIQFCPMFPIQNSLPRRKLSKKKPKRTKRPRMRPTKQQHTKPSLKLRLRLVVRMRNFWVAWMAASLPRIQGTYFMFFWLGEWTVVTVFRSRCRSVQRSPLSPFVFVEHCLASVCNLSSINPPPAPILLSCPRKGQAWVGGDERQERRAWKVS